MSCKATFAIFLFWRDLKTEGIHSTFVAVDTVFRLSGSVSFDSLLPPSISSKRMEVVVGGGGGGGWRVDGGNRGAEDEGSVKGLEEREGWREGGNMEDRE